ASNLLRTSSLSSQAMRIRKPAPNIALAILGLTCIISSYLILFNFIYCSTFVFQNPQHRQCSQRWLLYYSFISRSYLDTDDGVTPFALNASSCGLMPISTVVRGVTPFALNASSTIKLLISSTFKGVTPFALNASSTIKL